MSYPKFHQASKIAASKIKISLNHWIQKEVP
ncbi:TPA: toxin-antitoxin system HicB family antitoxin [Pseudomonas aeruginosa]|uniref:Toxin-antitoxin system HicB family antitoxin n=3 Tax=Pseudomonadaceae TaxID=135621 RepID=A0A365PYK2_9GAMM|nr:toxin-antitoxin system HicB family antitoxin [Salmonella enterica subsp. enterica serovar Braenderup]EIU2566748.1 toxin-antitoxin system HicB family antitoxin [Pseudomonas aeruginosa]MBK3746964.1 toxin-antitoxin system HicB family antitoxin [Stutzerimonas balearica]MBP7657216.1 toxin-antitoxin system HicB family antitoxin [Pseudoxanthomonas sp.]MCF5091637.1 toxin-antitoxin system HicB family antitoxin [Stenotrophomonas sp. PA-6-5C]NKQ13361.1 toxin-antitoxin system HicB family antitoxin [Pse